MWFGASKVVGGCKAGKKEPIQEKAGADRMKWGKKKFVAAQTEVEVATK